MAAASNYLIALDDGHGPHTAGKRTPFIPALGRQIRENEFNKPVVDRLEKELRRCGFRTIQLAPTDLDTPLTTRTIAANRADADALVSVHFNAMGNTFEYSSARGFSAHIQEGLSNNSNAYRLAKLMVEELSKGTPQVNRGIVKQNLAITRLSAMPAVLLECGFMDDPGEALLMISEAFHEEVAKEAAFAICRFFRVAYIPDKPAAVVKPAAPVVVPASNEKEEEITMADLLKLSTNDGKNAQLRVLKRFEKKEPALSNIWREKVQKNEFTLHDFAEVFFVAVDRGYITGLVNTDALQERVEALESKIEVAVK